MRNAEHSEVRHGEREAQKARREECEAFRGAACSEVWRKEKTMSNYIFDTHSHYDDKAFDSDRDEILNGLFEKGIGKVVDVGADMVSSKMALELAGQYEFVYAALGVHPSEVEGLTESDMAWIVNHASHEKVVAIGEIGLDYHWPEPEPALQKRGFADRLNLQRSKTSDY